MIWSFLFSIGLFQGIFLMVVLASRKKENKWAATFLWVLLMLFVLANFDDLLLATRWYAIVPWSFGFSLASFLAYGPLFFLYATSLTDSSFKWQNKLWLHFAPFFILFLLYSPVLSMDSENKVLMLDNFLAGQFSMQLFDKMLAWFKVVHLGVYLYLVGDLIRRLKSGDGNLTLQLSPAIRAKWLATLVVLFSLVLMAQIGVSFINCWNGGYTINLNFGFTFFTCSIMYFIAYKLMLRPELISPGFSEKYSNLRLPKGEEELVLAELQRLLEEEKIFLDSNLKMRELARKIDIPSHRLSMLVNEKFGKSFSDFINSYRVEEFIKRLDEPHSSHITLYGLALEVGFNSKSAFNAAFKKLTGKTPSEFKKRKFINS